MRDGGGGEGYLKKQWEVGGFNINSVMVLFRVSMRKQGYLKDDQLMNCFLISPPPPSLNMYIL